MVEPRNPFMVPRRRPLPQQQGVQDTTSNAETPGPAALPPRQVYNRRPRFTERRAQPVVPEVQTTPEVPPVPQISKPVRNDSLLEAFIRLVNSLIKFREK